MTLEVITENLKDAYKQLQPGTMLHADQLMIGCRVNADLCNQWFYPADGNIYTVRKGEVLLGITRESQNLVLQNIDEAFRQLTQKNNYFSALEEAVSSFEHPATVEIDVKGLKLVKGDEEYGHFVINPKSVKELNFQQKLTALRIYGPDEDNFRQNMEMFSKAEISPFVCVLMPDYVKNILKNQNKEYLARASWFGNFNNRSSFSYGSFFYAVERYIFNPFHVCGIRKK